MSEYPPPGLNYGYGAYQPNPRPTSVTVLAIIGIILGGLGLLCGGLGLIGQLSMLATGGRNPFLPNAPTLGNHSVLAYGAFALFVRLLLSIALLAGSIGALSLKPWSRRLLLQWSVVVIIWATINLVVQLAWVGPVTMHYNIQLQQKLNPKGAQTFSAIAGPAQMIGAVIGWLVACVLPVLFLTLWRSPAVARAFDSGRLPPPLPYPQQPPGA